MSKLLLHNCAIKYLRCVLKLSEAISIRISELLKEKHMTQYELHKKVVFRKLQSVLLYEIYMRILI